MAGDHPRGHPLKAVREYLRNLLGRCTSADKPAVQPAPPLPEDDLELDERLRAFPGEMFAHLLLELPAHRSDIAAAYQAGDLPRLRDHVHKLLGGAAYCDAPELTSGLRELRLALKTGDPQSIDFYYLRAIDVIDATLRYSGYRG